MDHVAAARTAERGRIDKTAISCARTIQLGIAFRCCEGRHTYATTNQCRACNADTNTGGYPDTKARRNTNPNGHATTHGDTRTHANSITDSNARAYSDTNAGSYTDTDAGSHTDADTGAPDLQPCVHDRHGERRVEQPDRQ